MLRTVRDVRSGDLDDERVPGGKQNVAREHSRQEGEAAAALTADDGVATLRLRDTTP